MNALAEKFFHWRFAILLVLGAAIVLRLTGIDQWSVWQDEETSIYFSQRLDRSFAQAFPLFFAALGWLYQWTGISVAAGRVLAGAFGVAGIWLTYVLCRKVADRQVGLVAALLLTVCLGHLFWSQSIRYYACLAAVEVAAMILLVDGFEQRRPFKLVAASVLVVVGMLIHFTAVLMLPVVVGYVMLVHLFRVSDGLYGWKGCLAVLPAMLLGFGVLLPRFMGLLKDGSMGPNPYVQYPSDFLLRYVGFFGIPMFALALAAPLFSRQFGRRTFFIFFSLGVIPMLEILVIGRLKLSITAWYHALVSIYGFAALASMTLVGAYRAGFHKSVVFAGLSSAAYYGAFLGLYYTGMHGDRPRWQEGIAFIQQAAAIDSQSTANVRIYATIPEIVHFYLGVSPGLTKESRIARFIPAERGPDPPERDEWYIVKASHVPPDLADWLASHCLLLARYDAHTVWIDRSVLVYYRPASDQAYRDTIDRIAKVQGTPRR